MGHTDRERYRGWDVHRERGIKDRTYREREGYRGWDVQTEKGIPW